MTKKYAEGRLVWVDKAAGLRAARLTFGILLLFLNIAILQILLILNIVSLQIIITIILLILNIVILLIIITSILLILNIVILRSLLQLFFLFFIL